MQTDRILGDIRPQLRIVIAVAVVVQAGFRVVLLALETDRLVDFALFGQQLAPWIVVRPPDDFPPGVAQGYRRSQMVAMVVADFDRGFAAFVQYVPHRRQRRFGGAGIEILGQHRARLRRQAVMRRFGQLRFQALAHRFRHLSEHRPQRLGHRFVQRRARQRFQRAAPALGAA